MHGSFIGIAQVNDLPTPMTNQVVVDRMRLLFSTVVLLLHGFVFGAINGALGAIYEKLQPRAVLQYRFEPMRVALWQLFLVAQRLIENPSQTMHPLVSLGLSDAKQKPLDCLGRVLPKVEQDGTGVCLLSQSDEACGLRHSDGGGLGR